MPLDSEPPRRCPEHAQNPASGPCGPCGYQRETHEEWTRQQALQAQERADRERRERLDLARASRQAINHCTDCDTTGYLPGGAVCHHRTEAEREASRRGLELVRAALAPTTPKPEDTRAQA